MLVAGFELATRLVTAGEYLEFIRDAGYRAPSLWLSDGWAEVQASGWTAPLYWSEADGAVGLFTLGGRRPLDPPEPVCHLSCYEADAYARWAGARHADRVRVGSGGRRAQRRGGLPRVGRAPSARGRRRARRR